MPTLIQILRDIIDGKQPAEGRLATNPLYILAIMNKFI